MPDLPTPLSPILLKTCQTTIWFHFRLQTQNPLRLFLNVSALELKLEQLKTTLLKDNFFGHTQTKASVAMDQTIDAAKHFALGMKQSWDTWQSRFAIERERKLKREDRAFVSELWRRGRAALM